MLMFPGDRTKIKCDPLCNCMYMHMYKYCALAYLQQGVVTYSKTLFFRLWC